MEYAASENLDLLAEEFQAMTRSEVLELGEVLKTLPHSVRAAAEGNPQGEQELQVQLAKIFAESDRWMRYADAGFAPPDTAESRAILIEAFFSGMERAQVMPYHIQQSVLECEVAIAQAGNQLLETEIARETLQASRAGRVERSRIEDQLETAALTLRAENERLQGEWQRLENERQAMRIDSHREVFGRERLLEAKERETELAEREQELKQRDKRLRFRVFFDHFRL